VTNFEKKKEIMNIGNKKPFRMVSDIDHAISPIKITSEELVEDSDESD
jgi:hypothetical protein